jgi:hypothetical protein
MKMLLSKGKDKGTRTRVKTTFFMSVEIISICSCGFLWNIAACAEWFVGVCGVLVCGSRMASSLVCGLRMANPSLWMAGSDQYKNVWV